MYKSKKIASLLIAAMFALALASCGKEAPNYGSENRQPAHNNSGSEDGPAAVVRSFPNVDSLVRTATIVGNVLSSSTRSICDGVSETDMTLTLTTGQPENIYIMAIDLKEEGISLSVALPGNITSAPASWDNHKPLREMAGSLEKADSRVVAMINGDFWDTSTLIPRGPVVSNSYVVKTTFEPLSSGKQGVSYVGVDKDGAISIDASSKFSAAQANLAQATGSGLRLVKNALKVDNSNGPDTERHPRTAIGYTDDNYVFFFCVDGRHEGVSEGMMMDDMGSIFAALKCREAVNLDGGGSTQMLRRIGKTAAGTGVYETCNHPSDQVERGVADAWAVIRTGTDDSQLQPLTIKEFAKGFVKLLDVWEAHTGTIEPEGSHSGTAAFTGAHFIPLYSAMASSDNNKFAESLVSVGERTFKLHQAWELAAIGIIDLITSEGMSVQPSSAAVSVHTLADGTGMDAVLPEPSNLPFGGYPWNESTGDLNLSETNPVSMELLAHMLPWMLKAGPGIGNIPNYTDIGAYGINGFTGRMCPMRIMLVMARFYKTVLDANISGNVYTYMKDRTVDPTLY